MQPLIEPCFLSLCFVCLFFRNGEIRVRATEVRLESKAAVPRYSLVARTEQSSPQNCSGNPRLQRTLERPCGRIKEAQFLPHQNRHRHRADDHRLVLKSQLCAIAELPNSGLRKIWRDHFGDDSPPVRSRELLRQLLAWRLQTEATGGMGTATERSLTRIAESVEQGGSYEPKVRRSLAAGVVLTREWKGVVHRVTVTADGFRHLDRSYRSLSDIARTITGTRWSGPRFFGLEQKERTSKATMGATISSPSARGAA